MARLQVKPLDTPDEVRSFPNGSLEIYELDDVIVGRTVFEPGWHWAEHVKPIAGTELCMYHHMGVCLSGRLGVRMSDGTAIEIGTGSVFDIPPGHDGWVIGDEPWVTYDFAGMRAFGRPAEAGERTLASILFTDIVGSTETAERVGDRAWRELIGQLNERTQFEIDRYRGRLIKTTGDGVLAVFDGAERTVRAAAAICLAAKAMGIAIRAGVHTGEVEVVAGDVRGLAVHLAARILGLAGPSEVVVSSTTEELLAGSGLSLVDRGEHELKGISGRRRVFALAEAPGPVVAS
jgi:class 3 adenylate cyclase